MICVIKLLAQSLSRALACVLLLGQLMMSPIFCYVAPITADMGKLVTRHLLTQQLTAKVSDEANTCGLQGH